MKDGLACSPDSLAGAGLIVASLMPGDGPTGVETHFNQILQLAQGSGVATALATPYVGRSIARRPATAVRRMLAMVRPEWSVLWGRWYAARRLRSALAEALTRMHGRPVTIYAQDPLSAEVALSLRGSYKFRIVLVVHYNEAEALETCERGLCRPGGHLWKQLYSREVRVLPQMDQVIFVSAYMRSIVAKRVPELMQRRIGIIHNTCADPDPDLLGEPPNRDLISIGTLEPRKNQSFLLHVLAECRERNRVLTLSIVGDGPDLPRLRTLTDELGLLNQVQFLGFLPTARLEIPRHRLLVHSARAENMPITLVEALSYGRPVIAAPVGGIPEIVRPGEQGLFWNLDDVRASAATLLSALESDTLGLLSISARDRYLNHFAKDILGPRWLQAIMGTG